MRGSQRPSKRSTERGVALISVIGMLLVLLVFTGAMLDQLALEANSVRSEAASNLALTAAGAGVHAMVEQIQTDLALNLPSPKGAITYTYPEPGGSPAATQYVASIVKTYSTGSQNYYQITSTGTFDNGVEHAQRTVMAIARSVPLSSFASFSNYESNQFGRQVWYLSSQHFNGPVYSGGPMRIAYATPAPGNTPNPIFEDTVQTLSPPIWGSAPASPSPTDWLSVVNGGQPNFAVNATSISLPQPKDDLYVMSEAWEGDGNATGYPSPDYGVFVNGPASFDPALCPTPSGYCDAASTPATTLSTGLYINVGPNGNVSIDASSSGNTETLTLTSPAFSSTTPTYYQVVETFTSPCTGSTVIQRYTGKPAKLAAQQTFSGVPCGEPGPLTTNPGNGAVFSTGSITMGTPASPDVTLQGQYTFVTPDSNLDARSITLLGNLLYSDPTQDKVALWADDVILKTLATNITLDASIIAGYPGEVATDGDFNNFYCTSTGCGAKDQGTLTINGGLIENARGAVGEVVLGKQYGFARVINFDSRFATSPPPYNPSTGALSIIAWQDLGT